MAKNLSINKLFSFLLSILIIFSLGGMNTVHASSFGDAPIHINEYEALQKLNGELKKNRSIANGMSPEQLYIIENYRDVYTEKIINLQSWTIQQLKFFDYTDDQIYAIKNFDGSDAMLKRASSTCTVSGDFNSFKPSSSGSTAELIMEFRWRGVQSNWFNDIFAVAWSSPFNATHLDGYVQYKNDAGNVQELHHSPEPEGLYGSYIEFPKYKNGDHESAYYVTAGSMIIDLKSNVYVGDITAYAEYGYNAFNISPSVSIGGDLSISFSSNIVVMDTYRCFR